MTAIVPLHPAQRRFLAEDLVRLRRSDEQRRYAAPQRAAKVDANPHQVDAVIFALARLREGGCILADEVGLGKTIEAGLVIAQLVAEGAKRILLITPKPLVGQWRQELFQLFSVDAIEAHAEVGAFDGEGVFLMGREAAGSVRGRDALMLSEEFDLCVIDEAHEMFAGIYKRFDDLGQYDETSTYAQIAGRVREVLQHHGTPVMLLTATPIQNNLAELWGLVQYVDPLGTLLGDLPTFREVFCGADERQVAQGQDLELKDRLQVVLKRTLRRDAQPFLEKPFVGRQARLFEYPMSPAEKSLYDDVTQYLLEPGILAFQGSHRQLLLISFHRLMASSTPALAAALEGVARRLRKLGEDPSLENEPEPLVREPDADDGDMSLVVVDAGDRPRPEPAAVEDEWVRVTGYIERARALGAEDGKFRALLKALRQILDRTEGARKLVIFTESRVTQEYLRQRLAESGLVADTQITLFSGTNDGPRPQEAFARWVEETQPSERQRRQRDIAIRLALVHEFRTRTIVFISTEAGAKGLNLQFCDTVVNYDLPWNPQRIEQRIGRCHRYGQQRDVTVINFLAQGNITQALTFEILSQKLELFGTVLDASDEVLHRPSGDLRGEVLVSVLGGDYEAELRRIYDRARSIDEVTAELRALRDRVDNERRRFEEAHVRTAGLIEQHLDDDIRSVFRLHQQRVPVALAELDRDLLEVVVGWLDASGIPYKREEEEQEVRLQVGPSPLLPADLREGTIAAIGASKQRAGLSLAHPLVRAAVEASRSTPARMAGVLIQREKRDLHAGRRGRLRLVKLSFHGFEKIEALVPVLLLEDGGVLPPADAFAALRSPMAERSVPLSSVSDDELQDATDETLFALQSAVDAEEQKRFERALRQADRFIEDRLLVLRRRRGALLERVEQARQRRDGATGSEARTEAERALLSLETQLAEIEGSIGRLEHRDDDTFQRYLAHIHRRRFAPPLIERVFDLDLEIQ
jgi:adenine-specific DNA-methyltransferase